MNEAEQIVDTIGSRLRLGPGFFERDQRRVIEALSSLNRHLAHWRPETVDLRLSVKGRESLNQRVTLEVWLPGCHSLIANSHERDLDRALIDVRKVIVREIEEERARREPQKGGGHHSTNDRRSLA